MGSFSHTLFVRCPGTVILGDDDLQGMNKEELARYVWGAASHSLIRQWRVSGSVNLLRRLHNVEYMHSVALAVKRERDQYPNVAVVAAEGETLVEMNRYPGRDGLAPIPDP